MSDRTMDNLAPRGGVKVGFTGTQEGMSFRQRLLLRKQLRGAAELHHGDCMGADEEADGIARALNVQIHIHPPIDSKKQAFCFQEGDVIYPPYPYLERNRDIVAATHRLVAAPRTDTEELRSGTWATIRYARRLGRRIDILKR